MGQNFFVLDYEGKKSLLEVQFYLVYKGHFTYQDVDTMPIYELLWFYDKLVEMKKLESGSISEEELEEMA